MEPRSVYELVEEHYGEPVSPDLVLRVQTERDAVRADDFRWRYLRWRIEPAKVALPAKDDAELRPLVLVSQANANLHLQRAFGRYHEAGLWSLWDGLVQHLLYCHGVALMNPLGYLCERRQYSSHRTIAQYLAFLNAISPLVEAGVVQLVELGPSLLDQGYVTAVRTPSETNPSSNALSSEQLAPVVSRLQDTAGPKWDINGHYWTDTGLDPAELARLRERFVRLELGGLADSSHITQRHPGAFDLLLSSAWQESALRATVAENPGWLGIATSSATADLRVAELQALQRLMAVPLADLSGIGPGDLVTIRRDDDTFAAWRSALRAALAHVGDEVDDPLAQRYRDLSRSLTEELHARALLVETGINRSSVLAAGRKGAVAFAVGCLKQGLHGNVDPVSNLSAGAARAGSSLAQSALAERRARPVRDAVRRHQVLFAS